ncbi:unnamed protein product, partial [Discosporangium mesarthrocarpum]
GGYAAGRGGPRKSRAGEGTLRPSLTPRMSRGWLSFLGMVSALAKVCARTPRPEVLGKRPPLPALVARGALLMGTGGDKGKRTLFMDMPAVQLMCKVQQCMLGSSRDDVVEEARVNGIMLWTHFLTVCSSLVRSWKAEANSSRGTPTPGAREKGGGEGQ